MAVLGRTFLGVEINASEIHIAEVQGSWPHVQILRSYDGPTPPGVLDGDRIADPVALGAHIQEILRLHKFGTRDAVVGLPVRAILTRTLDIPLAPANEMRIIISGELSHYQTLRENVETFDFVPLDAPSRGPETGQSVLVMAAEELVVAGYSEMADHAGLRLLALEPLPIALLRALSPQVVAHPDALCLLIHHGDVELAILEQGRLRLYRRLDISSDDLLSRRKDSLPSVSQHDLQTPTRIPFGMLDEEPAYPTEPEPEAAANLSALHTLAVELQRSLEYYACEFAPSQPIGVVLLATPHPELEMLPGWLAGALSLTVLPGVFANCITSTSQAEPFDLEAPLDRRLGAVGLAMREMAGLPPALPRLNLSRQRRPVASEATLRRRLAVALVTSIALICFGTILAYRIGLRANHLDHAVSHLKEDIQEMQLDKQTRLDSLQIRNNLLQSLSQEGFAVPRILDAIGDAVSPQAGLVEVSLNRNGQVGIQGDAANEQAVIGTVEALKRSPYLENTSLTSFNSLQSQVDMPRLVRFQVTSQLAGFMRSQTASAAGPASQTPN